MLEDLRKFKFQFKQELSHNFSIADTFSAPSPGKMDKDAWVSHYFRNGVVNAISIYIQETEL
jgi:hypothetical protein